MLGTLNDIQLYILIALLLLLVISIFYAIKFALIIIKMQDAIEDCLDEIDNKYSNISNILEIPIFYDSPEVKRVLSDIKDVKVSLMYVANTLTNSNILEDDIQQYEQIDEENYKRD
jgi:hypothetical protein